MVAERAEDVQHGPVGAGEPLGEDLGEARVVGGSADRESGRAHRSILAHSAVSGTARDRLNSRCAWPDRQHRANRR